MRVFSLPKVKYWFRKQFWKEKVHISILKKSMGAFRWKDTKLENIFPIAFSKIDLSDVGGYFHMWGLKIGKMVRMYRVADPSCHPQISLCARIQKKTESWTGHPLKWQKSWTFHPQKMAESPTLVGVASSGLCHFLGVARVASSGLSFFSGFWHIGKSGGGKKDQPPCTI